MVYGRSNWVKYRVVKQAGSMLYYPEMKQLWWWKSIDYEETGFRTLEEALENIEQHKRIFSKKPKEVVWRGDE